MGTILVKDALHRAGVLLQDVNPAQFVFWPEKEMVDWFNDAEAAIVKYLPATGSRVDAIKLKAGTRQSIEAIAAADCKPGNGSVPAATIQGNVVLGVVRNMGADGLTAGRAVRVIDRKDLDGQNPGWHTLANPNSRIDLYTFDPATPRYFYVYPPVPASPVIWVEMAYTAQPIKAPNTGTPGAELYKVDGASVLAISLPDEFIDDIVAYIVARANMKDVEQASAQKAALFTNLFLGSLNAKVAVLTGNNPNLQRLPFAPEPIGAAK